MWLLMENTCPYPAKEGEQLHVFQQNNKDFNLLEKFDVVLGSGKATAVVSQKEKFVKALYEDLQIYNVTGHDFCAIFDVIYSKTGTEAIAEAFYHVMEIQETEARQSHETLAV